MVCEQRKPMTATVHLLVGPAGSGKTATLIERARAVLRLDPGAVLWLAPTHRALGELRSRLVGAGGACGLRLRTFADLAADVLDGERPTRPLSAAQQRLLVEELVSDLAARGRLVHFSTVHDTVGFASGLLGLLHELQSAGVSAGDFARAAGQQAGEDGAGRKDRECARLYACYLQELRRRGRHDSTDRERRAAEELARGGLVDDMRCLVVDGFSDFTPGQHALLAALAGRTEEMWISLLDEPGEERAELFARPQTTRRHFEQGPATLHAPEASPGPALPAGLAHLARQLFRPLRRIEVSPHADGLALIEAPGLLGEVRLVARRIKTLLLEGVAAGDILVTAREIGPYADLLREVLSEHAVPFELEGSDSLLGQPAVALLLRALRLPEEDFPFASVTALLRSTLFRPDWPEAAGSADVPARAEALLRLLGEPRGRDAYLSAVARWAERALPGLEDEAAEESRRARIHELAVECQAFLRRFFAAFDGAPARASPAEHAAWLRRFADDLGIAAAALAHERDRLAWEALWAEVAAWQDLSSQPIDRRTFARRLAALAASAGLPRSAAGPGRVRALSASQARHLKSDHSFILGMGERGFPRLGGPPSLLDDADREELARAGLSLPAATLSDEMLLFYQVACGARRELVLSYPAVDERGQEMLPGSFLLAVRDCFAEGAIPVERRRMLIERYAEDLPLCPAEYRVRVAAAWPDGSRRLPDDLRASLAGAALVAQQRFRQRDLGCYEGLFQDPLLIEWVGKQFGPERVFSPTALEDYVACPFRFFLGHVLHLDALEEPTEEIEVTRRGMAFHRALARLHSRLRDKGVHEPTPEVREEVLREIGAAIDEDVARAPSPASKELWRLEGQRLLRLAGKYPSHWAAFVEPWLKRGVRPRPHLFEVDFGLPVPEGQAPTDPLVIRVEQVEVRISGRIDRVDLATLDEGVGFWIIDYKTGRSSHYTGTDLAQYRRLQLTLYALAAETVLLAGQNARPLGLAYWLVGEGGAKVALPGRAPALWHEDAKRWPAVRERLQQWVATLVQHIRRGAFPLAPRSENCTQTCPYGRVCRITQARGVGKSWELPLPEQGGVGGTPV
jgi:ATP-dependent helicase/DNAse subunit B